MREVVSHPLCRWKALGPGPSSSPLRAESGPSLIASRQTRSSVLYPAQGTESANDVDELGRGADEDTDGKTLTLAF